MLEVGSQAPDFTLKDQTNNDVSLSDFKGRWFLLWWYPAANAAGEATQGSALQATLDKFLEMKCSVAGVSFDQLDETAAFHQEMDFSFPLLSDPEQIVGATYQARRELASGYLQFAKRISYLIDPDGRIVYSYEVTDPGGHAATVLADLEAAQR